MKALKLLLCSLTLLTTACTDSSETRLDKAVKTQSSSVQMAKTPTPDKGMVVAANPHATRAGIKILEAGGSAIDAAIAVQTVLGLVEPQSSGLGGGAFMVVYDSQTGDVWSYDGREEAPSDITKSLFLDDKRNAVRRFPAVASGKSTGTPGAIVMLHMAHEDYGKLPWGPLMDPAIDLAENGFAISPRMARLMKRMGNFFLKDDPTAFDYFFTGEKDADDKFITHGEGFVRDNQPYAESLKLIAKNPRALLEGPLGEKIVQAVASPPRAGSLSLADMARYQPIKSAGLCSPYRDYTICGANPPASGGVAVQSIMGILSNFDMASMNQTLEGWHHFAEASFLAYADRDKYVADPKFVNVPVKKMLDPSYLSSRAELISPDKALENVTAGDLGPAGQDATPDNPGTSHFTVMDKNGLVVSITTTVEAPFGSQRMVGGFMLNNQLTDFSFTTVDDEGLPVANAPAPGKRPRSSMSPTIVFDKDGEFLFTTGSPGGNSIIAYTAKTIIGILDWGLTPQEAVELPNFIARNKSIRLEENGMDEAIISGLEAMGHTIVRSKGEISGLHIIYRGKSEGLSAGVDPRREGTAQTY